MKANIEQLKAMTVLKSPFFEVMKLYSKWGGDISFRDDLFDYLLTGFVVARPTCFWMAKIIELDGVPTWFVRVAHGGLREMMFDTLPGYLPQIALCRVLRNGKMKTNKWPMDRFLKLAAKRRK